MARYRPSRYRLDGVEERREVALGALLQSAVLKRFESCWYACLLTIQRMLRAHDAFLEGWGRGVVPNSDALAEAARAELDETGTSQWLEELLDGGLETEPISRYRPEFGVDVRRDRDALRAIEGLLQGLDAGRDPKLRLLGRLLEESPAGKVVVFSTFADTVRYLDRHLPAPAAGRERIAVVGSETSPDERTGLLARFCPDTVIRPGYEPPEGEVDLLLSNDVLSEGQNLQQAAAVISYDMPWNPQRVVQRYGRVIRLKSPHGEVHLSTMLPEPGDLEAILGLEITIRRKILAASPYGMEVEVMDSDAGEGPDPETEVRSWAERLAAGDPTVLNERDDAGAGRGLVAEALRAELRRAAQEGELDRLRDLPWGVGAAFRRGTGASAQAAPGVFLACRVRGSDRSYWRYVSPRGILTEPAAILRLIDPEEAAGVPDPPVDLEAAWQQAVESIVDEHNTEAAQAPSESVGPIQRWALGVLADPSVGEPVGSADAWNVLQVGRAQPLRRALVAVKRLLDRKDISSAEAARQIVAVTESYGLRPVEPLPARAPITAADVGVVCWMAVL